MRSSLDQPPTPIECRVGIGHFRQTSKRIEDTDDCNAEDMNERETILLYAVEEEEETKNHKASAENDGSTFGLSNSRCLEEKLSRQRTLPKPQT